MAANSFAVKIPVAIDYAHDSFFQAKLAQLGNESGRVAASTID
jgi:hypothetical protein